MTYFENIQAYIQELCQKHKKLLHGEGGTAFMPMTVADESGAIYPDIKPTYVKVLDASSSVREGDMVWVIQLAVMQNVSMNATVGREQAMEIASMETQEILYDFIARIRNQDDESCSFMTRLLDGNIEPVALSDQSAVGWQYFLRFNTQGPDYNANAWEDDV
jgi:hypothetical protein